jgi:prepilin-type N-terminal cleavage/methylation domain-containing protein/prepilin-type processing-associated H-X9-DG protein
MLTTRHERQVVGKRNEGKQPGAAGFTLVELLVVIAVIAVLLAVVVPVTMETRNRARAVACSSNLRQLSGALLAYGRDWDDKLPSLTATPFAGSFAGDRWPDGSSATQLRAAISKYVKNGGVYRCGNDLGSPEYGFDQADGSVFTRAGSSYLPWSAARSGRYGVAINGARTAALSPLSSQVLLRDYGSSWHGYRRRSGLDVETLTVANAAYADGHAATVQVFAVTASGRVYACWVSSNRGKAGTVFVSGGSGDVRAELSGKRAVSSAGAEMRFSLSGAVSSGDTVYNVDRVFMFGADTELEAAFRQVVAWIDGFVVR